MKIFKNTILCLLLTVSFHSLYALQTLPSPHNFRWALVNTIERYCLTSQDLKKLKDTDPCLMSLDPLIDITFIEQMLRKNDTLTKKSVFQKQCKRHQITHTAHMTLKEIHDYCKDAYDHFKNAHNLYMNSTRAQYLEG